MTGQTPPVPGRLPVDSRGRWAGTRLRRESRFPRRDGDGHPAGRGLPRTEAAYQPLLREQACGRQVRQVAGAQGAGLASDTPHGRPGPRVLHGFPGTPACDRALSSDTCARLSLHRAISCMLEIWLDYYGDDFCQLPEFPSLMKILQFVRQHMPGSDVELRARRNLQQFRRLHTVEPEAGASAQGKHPEAAQEQVPALTVGTAAPSGPAGIQAVPAAGAEGSARAEAPAGEVKPLQIVVTALVHCSALEEPPAPTATPEEEQAPAPAIGVPRVPEPPPASGTTGFDP
ncbi:uncharacterized protein [Canis lupus baileyi]|uniref:uncharacterized protein isoform X1 n=1 Tax=Canis lupus baileyi TaxID=143281 RepID=UPI003B975ABF